MSWKKKSDGIDRECIGTNLVQEETGSDLGLKFSISFKFNLIHHLREFLPSLKKGKPLKLIIRINPVYLDS